MRTKTIATAGPMVRARGLRLILAGLCLSLASSALDAQKPAIPVVEHAGMRWYPIGAGLEASKAKSLPLLIVYAGADPDAYWRALEPDLRKLQRRTKKFVAIELTKPIGNDAIAVVGGVDDEPFIALADFRKTVLARFDKECPKRSRLNSALTRCLASNAEIADLYRKIRLALDKSRYALKSKKYKECIQHYLMTDSLAVSPDSELIKARTKLRSDIDAVIRERRKEAEKLEKTDTMTAIQKYERLSQDFPLPTLKKDLQEKLRELWSRTRGYGG